MRIDATDYFSGPQAEREITIAFAHFKNRFWLLAGLHVIKSHADRSFLAGYLEGLPPGDPTMTLEIVDSWKYTRSDRFEDRNDR